MEAGIDHDPVVRADLKTAFLTCVFEMLGFQLYPDIAEFLRNAACFVPLRFKLVVQIGHVKDDAGADAMLKRKLVHAVAITRLIHFFQVHNVIR